LRSDDNSGNDDKNQNDADEFNISQAIGHQQKLLVQISAWLFGLTSFENPERNHTCCLVGHYLTRHRGWVAPNIRFGIRIRPRLKQQLGMFGILRVSRHV
jgi:hypothetical protein